MGDKRRLSFIVVPHGELRTRTFEVSYGVLLTLLGAGFLLLAVFVVMMASWWFVAAQAARVPGLEEEVARLESERGQVAALARDLAEAEEQYERVRRLLGVEGAAQASREVALPPLRGDVAGGAPAPEASAMPSSWPLSQAGFITQMREVTDGASHPGLDIAVPADTYIRASGPGTVVDAGLDEVYGRYILLDHGNGLESMYGHASRLFVEPGDLVEQDEVIALSGSTGRSTAPHLHFEIRKDGQAVDPLTYVRQPS